MKRKVTIGPKKPHPLYMPKDLVKEGFVGKTYMLESATTIVIAHPNASMKDVKRGLEIIISSIKLRLGED